MVTAARPGITAAAELRGAMGRKTNHTDESFLAATQEARPLREQRSRTLVSLGEAPLTQEVLVRAQSGWIQEKLHKDVGGNKQDQTNAQQG